MNIRTIEVSRDVSDRTVAVSILKFNDFESSFISDAPSHVCVVFIWLSDLESISIGDGGGGMEV